MEDEARSQKIRRYPMTAGWTRQAWMLAVLLAFLAATGGMAAVEAGRPTGYLGWVRTAAVGAWFAETFGSLQALASRFDEAPEGLKPPSGACGDILAARFNSIGTDSTAKFITIASPFGDLALGRNPVPGSSNPYRYSQCVDDGSPHELGLDELGLDEDELGLYDPKWAPLALRELASTWHVAIRSDYKAVYDDIVAAMRAQPFRPLGLYVGDPNIAVVGWALGLLYAAGVVLLAYVTRGSYSAPSPTFAIRALRWATLILLALGGWIVMGALLLAAVGSHQLQDTPIGVTHAVLEFSAVLALTLVIARSVWRLFLGIVPVPAPV